MRARNSLVVMAFVAFGSGCVREATITLPEVPDKIVVLSHFTPLQPAQVEVSLSQSLGDAGDPVIPLNAEVTISVEGKFLDKLFRVTGDGGRIYWQSRDTLETDATYGIVVKIPGYDAVEASSTAPSAIPPEAISIDTANIRLVGLTDGKIAYRVPLRVKPGSPPNGKKRFAFALRHEIAVFEIVDGEPVFDESYEAASKFLADGRTLSLVYDTPEKVVLIHENFWNDDGNELRVDALIPFDPENERPRQLFVEWRTLSEEFYQYHLSLARQGNNLPLSDPDALYNNILGGYGNFSGYSAEIYPLSLPKGF